MTSPTQHEEPGAASLDDYTDDSLAEIAEAVKAEGRRLTQMADGARFELERRLIERGATVLDTEHWAGKLASSGYEHIVDDPVQLLMELRRHIAADEADRAFPMPPPPQRGIDHRVLNDLHKRGGRIAAVIDEYRRSAPKRPRLELTRKEEGAI